MESRDKNDRNEPETLPLQHHPLDVLTAPAERETGEQATRQRKTIHRNLFADEKQERLFYRLLGAAQDANLQGDPKRAKALATQALRIRPAAEIFTLLMSISEAERDFVRAEEYRLLFAFFSNDPVLWRELYATYMQSGQLPRAVLCLKRLSALTLDHREKQQLDIDRADLLIALGQTTQAETLLRRMWRESNYTDYSMLQQMAQLMFQRGRFGKLARIVTDVLEEQRRLMREEQTRRKQREDIAAAADRKSDSRYAGANNDDDDNDDGDHHSQRESNANHASSLLAVDGTTPSRHQQQSQLPVQNDESHRDNAAIAAAATAAAPASDFETTDKKQKKAVHFFLPEDDKSPLDHRGDDDDSERGGSSGEEDELETDEDSDSSESETDEDDAVGAAGSEPNAQKTNKKKKEKKSGESAKNAAGGKSASARQLKRKERQLNKEKQDAANKLRRPPGWAAAHRPKNAFDARGFLILINMQSELLAEQGRFAETIALIRGAMADLQIQELTDLPHDLQLRMATALALTGEVTAAGDILQALLDEVRKRPMSDQQELIDVLYDGAEMLLTVGRTALATSMFKALLQLLVMQQRTAERVSERRIKQQAMKQQRNDDDDHDDHDGDGANNSFGGFASLSALLDQPIDLTATRNNSNNTDDKISSDVQDFQRFNSNDDQNNDDHEQLIENEGDDDFDDSPEAAEARSTATAAVLYGLGRCAKACGDPPHAKQYFTAVLSRSPHHCMTRIALAEVLVAELEMQQPQQQQNNSNNSAAEQSTAAAADVIARAIELVSQTDADDFMDRVRLHAARAKYCYLAQRYVDAVTSGLYVLSRYLIVTDDSDVESVATGASKATRRTTYNVPTLSRSSSVLMPAQSLSTSDHHPLGGGGTSGNSRIGAASSIASSFRASTVGRAAIVIASRGSAIGGSTTYVGSAVGGSRGNIDASGRSLAHKAKTGAGGNTANTTLHHKTAAGGRPDQALNDEELLREQGIFVAKQSRIRKRSDTEEKEEEEEKKAEKGKQEGNDESPGHKNCRGNDDVGSDADRGSVGDLDDLRDMEEMMMMTAGDDEQLGDNKNNDGSSNSSSAGYDLPTLEQIAAQITDESFREIFISVTGGSKPPQPHAAVSLKNSNDDSSGNNNANDAANTNTTAVPTRTTATKLDEWRSLTASVQGQRDATHDDVKFLLGAGNATFSSSGGGGALASLTRSSSHEAILTLLQICVDSYSALGQHDDAHDLMECVLKGPGGMGHSAWKRKSGWSARAMSIAGKMTRLRCAMRNMSTTHKAVSPMLITQVLYELNKQRHELDPTGAAKAYVDLNARRLWNKEQREKEEAKKNDNDEDAAASADDSLSRRAQQQQQQQQQNPLALKTLQQLEQLEWLRLETWSYIDHLVSVAQLSGHSSGTLEAIVSSNTRSKQNKQSRKSADGDDDVSAGFAAADDSSSIAFSSGLERILANALERYYAVTYSASVIMNHRHTSSSNGNSSGHDAEQNDVSLSSSSSATLATEVELARCAHHIANIYFQRGAHELAATYYHRVLNHVVKYCLMIVSLPTRRNKGGNSAVDDDDDESGSDGHSLVELSPAMWEHVVLVLQHQQQLLPTGTFLNSNSNSAVVSHFSSNAACSSSASTKAFPHHQFTLQDLKLVCLMLSLCHLFVTASRFTPQTAVPILTAKAFAFLDRYTAISAARDAAAEQRHLIALVSGMSAVPTASSTGQLAVASSMSAEAASVARDAQDQFVDRFRHKVDRLETLYNIARTMQSVNLHHLSMPLYRAVCDGAAQLQMDADNAMASEGNTDNLALLPSFRAVAVQLQQASAFNMSISVSGLGPQHSYHGVVDAMTRGAFVAQL